MYLIIIIILILLIVAYRETNLKKEKLILWLLLNYRDSSFLDTIDPDIDGYYFFFFSTQTHDYI